MHQTRKLILEYLKAHGQATVDELARVLDLTSVTVRHHLDILRGEGLIAEPVIRHRSSPGRPQYVFTLTSKASEYFPSNYSELAAKVVDEVKATGQDINVIFEGVAARLAADAPQPVDGEPIEARLDRAVAFLNRRGYVARWENASDGYLLHTCHCPYEDLAPGHPELCRMDLMLVGHLLGTIPQPLSRVVEGGATCSYLLRDPQAVPA